VGDLLSVADTTENESKRSNAASVKASNIKEHHRTVMRTFYCNPSDARICFSTRARALKGNLEKQEERKDPA
jgi:hypothetical protein